jgi:hypothetical protein
MQDRWRSLRPTSEYDTGPGQELCEREWFDEVIIGPRVEALYTVVHGTFRGEKYGRGLHPFGPEFSEHVKSILARKHPVEDEEIIDSRGGVIEALVAVGHDVHGKAMFSESLAEIGPHVPVVFDDEHTHQLRLKPLG